MKMIRKMAALLIVLSMCIIFPCAAFAAPAHCDSTDSTTLVAEPVSLPSPSFSQSPSQSRLWVRPKTSLVDRGTLPNPCSPTTM